MLPQCRSHADPRQNSPRPPCNGQFLVGRNMGVGALTAQLVQRNIHIIALDRGRSTSRVVLAYRLISSFRNSARYSAVSCGAGSINRASSPPALRLADRPGRGDVIRAGLQYRYDRPMRRRVQFALIHTCRTMLRSTDVCNAFQNSGASGSV